MLYNGEKVITNNLDVYKELYETLNLSIEAINHYDDKIYSEYLLNNGNYFKFYSNNILEIGKFIIHWKTDEKLSNEYAKLEHGNFEVNLVNNNNAFDKEIELNNKKYVLYGL